MSSVPNKHRYWQWSKSYYDRAIPCINVRNESNITIEYAEIIFIKSIDLNDMYSFISYCQNTLNSSAGTRARKIVSIRQFWRYLKTKAHLIDNNIAEELENLDFR